MEQHLYFTFAIFLFNHFTIHLLTPSMIGIQRWWGLTSHKTYQDRQTDLIGKDDDILLCYIITLITTSHQAKYRMSWKSSNY